MSENNVDRVDVSRAAPGRLTASSPGEGSVTSPARQAGRLTVSPVPQGPVIAPAGRAGNLIFTAPGSGEPGPPGPPGPPTTIIGTLDDVGDLPLTGDPGDAYIIDGDLYVWDVEDEQWNNVGNIQGPPGAGLAIIGSLGDESELPADGNTTGDAYLIDGYLYVWDGDSWVNAGYIEGPPGPPGPEGSIVSTWRGAYVPSFTYVHGDIVEHDNKLWISRRGGALDVPSEAPLAVSFVRTGVIGAEELVWNVDLSGANSVDGEDVFDLTIWSGSAYDVIWQVSNVLEYGWIRVSSPDSGYGVGSLWRVYHWKNDLSVRYLVASGVVLAEDAADDDWELMLEAPAGTGSGGVYDVETDISSTPNVTYLGEAAPGSAPSASVWRIRRITEGAGGTSVDWAGGAATFTNAWTDRLTLTYGP